MKIDQPKTYLWWLLPLAIAGGLVCFVGVPLAIGYLVFAGTEVTKSGSEIEADELDAIQAAISIRLPPNTTGVELYYSSFQDEYLWVKLRINPSEFTVAEQIVQRLSDSGLGLSLLPSNMPINSNDIIFHQRGSWAQFKYGQAIITQENGIYYLYLNYFTT